MRRRARRRCGWSFTIPAISSSPACLRRSRSPPSWSLRRCWCRTWPILRSGEKNTVFVALEGGKFEPRAVVLGPQAEDDTYQVLSGLKEGERIVTSGQFMLDSESQLREAIQKMREPGGSRRRTAARRHERRSRGDEGHGVHDRAPPPRETNIVKYICPMPEHVSIEYDHPGKCPICGMTLVPVTRGDAAKLHPAASCSTTPAPCPSTATFTRPNRASAPSAA